MSEYKRYITTAVLILFLLMGVGLVYKVSCARNEMLRLRTAELSFEKGVAELGDYNTLKIDALLETVEPCSTEGLRFIFSSVDSMVLEPALSLKRVNAVVDYLKKRGISLKSLKITIVGGSTVLTVRIA